MPLSIADWFRINDIIQTHIQDNGIQSLANLDKNQLKNLVLLWTREVENNSDIKINRGEIIDAIVNHRIWDSVYPNEEYIKN